MILHWELTWQGHRWKFISLALGSGRGGGFVFVFLYSFLDVQRCRSCNTWRDKGGILPHHQRCVRRLRSRGQHHGTSKTYSLYWRSYGWDGDGCILEVRQGLVGLHRPMPALHQPCPCSHVVQVQPISWEQQHLPLAYKVDGWCTWPHSPLRLL